MRAELIERVYRDVFFKNLLFSFWEIKKINIFAFAIYDTH